MVVVELRGEEKSPLKLQTFGVGSSRRIFAPRRCGVLLVNCQFASLGCGRRRGAWVASPSQGEGEGEGLPTRQLNQWMYSKALTLVLSPCLRGEAGKRDVKARFLRTDNQRALRRCRVTAAFRKAARRLRSGWFALAD